MSQTQKAKLSKIAAYAGLEFLHAAKTMATKPGQFLADVAAGVLSPFAADYEKRIESKMKDQFPEWAKTTYTRDWTFESEADRISRIRAEAGRKGGLKSKNK